ncbi:hypothetical protein G8O24_25525 [Bradyrhizobium sp. INPA01-394B]|uniref:Uncharacterized protein n=1 Tax=Bradyrhizobium campsiandrae TaxID=1729892 RepID=A0ABR7UDQ5_9BRAD|nr:hypothetical protein [Bradyrhizobium campsiandrae]MBC9880692.1 hypothetical protein [Bradyrhizobium campsiandrae]MBC9982209.1 hypothetical protein [Bradyrhizobium campsiandrae]
MGSRPYTTAAFRNLMNSNYYPLANMKKSVAKLKASPHIDLPTLEYGQYQLLLTPASKWPQGSAKHWHKEKGRVRVDLEAQPNTTPLSKDQPDVVPLTRCALLDASVRKCFNSEPPIPMKTHITTHEETDPGADTHEIRLEWEYEGDSKTPTLLYLTMVCPYKPARDAQVKSVEAGEALSLG